ncbi:MAG TPA: hypothetical protein PK511_01010 [Chitinophagales bacterium]|nr:hypothetical protein [Chitinophagales bacterium]HMX03235.1 hypothetical protein [Chitinophagales bacterium]HMZ88412.1 hypothetical protein [Chitinophagales bacterium]HNA56678.1 hypothetical protein [Chitinophagales bacterium]HNE45666.1 hypothetical protein [Chitinophagales bacterium]
MSKLQEDNVFVGMAVAVFFMVTTYYAFFQLNESLSGNITIKGAIFTGVTERFIATLAVFFNILPFVIYMRVRKDNCMRGVGIITVLSAMFILVYFYIQHHSTIFQ